MGPYYRVSPAFAGKTLWGGLAVSLGPEEWRNNASEINKNRLLKAYHHA